MIRFLKTNVLLSLVAMLLAAEGIARLDDWIRYEVAPWASPNYDIDLRVVDSLGVRGRPHGRYQQFSLNNYGFRSSHDIQLRPDSRCVRVMTLGASQTLGYLEAPGEEYPAQLERMLQATGKCHEVLNAGIAGMSLPSISYTWNHYWSAFAPDLVILYPSPTPYLGEAPPRPPRRQDLVRAENAWPSPSLRPRLIHRAKEAIEYPAPVQRMRTRRWLAEALGRIPADSVWTEVPRDRLDLYRSDLTGLADSIARRGARLLIMTHAIRFPHTPSPEDSLAIEAWRAQYPRATPRVLLAFDSAAARVTREVATANEYQMVDLACVMTGQRELFGDPIHFTTQGATIVASTVAHSILPNGSAPAASVASGSRSSHCSSRTGDLPLAEVRSGLR
jgi:hypothetical protein